MAPARDDSLLPGGLDYGREPAWGIGRGGRAVSPSEWRTKYRTYADD